MTGPTIELRADQPLGAWGSLVAFGPLDDAAIVFRKELGLPTEGPIVMTGHQPIFWHPGILAKYLAADALAEARGGHAAWLVVDQDAVDPFAIDVPIRPDGAALEARALRLAGSSVEGLAASTVPPSRPLSIDDAFPHAQSGTAGLLGAVTEALGTHADSPTAARQVVRANFDVLRGVLPLRPIVYASDLNTTTLFGELLDRMAENPESAVGAYNEAARLVPEAGISELASNDIQDIYELPLWTLKPGAPRRRVYRHDLDSLDRSTLAPRALLVTAMMRLAGCELFVHGMGGAVYDTVSELWMKQWLNATLAPSAAISADLRLDLGAAPIEVDDVRRARWLAHSARHNPALLGNHTAQDAKNKLLSQIDAARERGERPAPFFRTIHENRLAYEFSHMKELAALRQDADSLARRAAEAAVAARRDWPAAIYPQERLLELRSTIRRAISDGHNAGRTGLVRNPSRAR